jgi:hypothetical protein
MLLLLHQTRSFAAKEFAELAAMPMFRGHFHGAFLFFTSSQALLSRGAATRVMRLSDHVHRLGRKIGCGVEVAMRDLPVEHGSVD